MGFAAIRDHVLSRKPARGAQLENDVFIELTNTIPSALAASQIIETEREALFNLINKLTKCGIKPLRNTYRKAFCEIVELKNQAKKSERAKDITFGLLDGETEVTTDGTFTGDIQEFAEMMKDRYALFYDSSKTCVADLHAIGQKNWIVTLTHFVNTYKYAYAGEADSSESERRYATSIWLHDQDVKRATRLIFDPRKPSGFSTNAQGIGEINCYIKPAHHDRSGDVKPFLDFMKHLIPCSEERQWYVERTAYKWCNPAIRGPGVIMVANGVFGTGRGILEQILGRLHGRDVVRPVDWSVFCGEGTPGQWNDWIEGCLYAVVRESSDKDARSYYSKAAAYEVCKVLVEPSSDAPITIKKRNTHPYPVDIFMSTDIHTNHMDVMAMSRDDRRFFVVTNGLRMSQAMSEVLVKWMNGPENIGALADYFEGLKIECYNPFTPPPMTEGKKRMIGLAEDDETIAIRDLIETSSLYGADVITKTMFASWLARWMRTINGATGQNQDSEKERARIDNLWSRYTHRLDPGKDIAGTGATRVRVRVLRDPVKWSASSNKGRTENLELMQRTIDNALAITEDSFTATELLS
jgi:hypothetical protein